MSKSAETSIKSGVMLAAPADSLESCLDRMAAANVGSILITEDKRPVGIFTERDLLREWRRIADPLIAQGPISQLFTRKVFALNLAEISKAPREMLERRIRHIPLVDGEGRIIGIISMRDILAAQLRSGTLPRLNLPGGKGSPPGPPRTMHLVNPTAQLAQICKHFLPSNWVCQTWVSVQAMEELPELKGTAPGLLNHSAFMLDLDGIAEFTDWRAVLKHFIKLLTRLDNPALFLVSSPTHFSDKDLAAIRQVAEKARWHAYQRPLPITALADDLAVLNEPPA